VLWVYHMAVYPSEEFLCHVKFSLFKKTNSGPTYLLLYIKPQNLSSLSGQNMVNVFHKCRGIYGVWVSEFLDFVHRPVFLKHNVSKSGSVSVFRCEAGATTMLGTSLSHVVFWKHWTMDKVQKLSNPNCSTIIVRKYTECSALNVNKLKKNLKPKSVLQKSIHCQTVDLTEFLMCSVALNMATISGTTNIKTIFSFSPCSGIHFSGNALCSSNDSVTQLSVFHDKQCLLKTPVDFPEEPR
jgi:hypothetical protein